MGINRQNESDKVTGDELEDLIDRTAAGPGDRKREQSDPEDDAEELDLEEDDAEIEDSEEE